MFIGHWLFYLSNDPLSLILPSCHPWLPVVATASGQRHAALAGDSSDSESDEEQRENAVKLWWTGPGVPSDSCKKKIAPLPHIPHLIISPLCARFYFFPGRKM